LPSLLNPSLKVAPVVPSPAAPYPTLSNGNPTSSLPSLSISYVGTDGGAENKSSITATSFPFIKSPSKSG